VFVSEFGTCGLWALGLVLRGGIFGGLLLVIIRYGILLVPNCIRMKRIILLALLASTIYLGNAQTTVPSTTVKMCGGVEKIEGKLSSAQVMPDGTKKTNYFYIANNTFYVTHIESKGNVVESINRYVLPIAKVDIEISMLTPYEGDKPDAVFYELSLGTKGNEDIDVSSKYANVCDANKSKDGRLTISFDNKEECRAILKMLGMDTYMLGDD
jgi:hypothetical protein